MKNLIRATLLTFIHLASSCEKKNEGYTIKGHITGFPDSTKIYLKSHSIDSDIDSAMVIGNAFVLHGTLPNTPEQVWLHTKVNDKFIYTNALIGNEKITLEGDIIDFPWNVKVSGSKFDKDRSELQNLTADLYKERDSLVRFFFSLKPEEREKHKQKIWGTEIQRIDSITQALTLQYIKSHPNSYSSIINLGYLKNRLPKDSVQLFYDNLAPEIKASRFAKIVSIFLKDKILGKNVAYYDFTALNQKNDSVRLSEFQKGKYILLDFTAYNCGPCILAAKELRKINRTHNDSLTIISFSNDIKKEDWLTSLERDSVSWPSLWDGKGRYSKTAIKYGVNGFPTFFLIDPSGKIIDKWTGFGEGSLLTKLEKFKS